jgi:hypothetical protein
MSWRISIFNGTFSMYGQKDLGIGSVPMVGSKITLMKSFEDASLWNCPTLAFLHLFFFNPSNWGTSEGLPSWIAYKASAQWTWTQVKCKASTQWTWTQVKCKESVQWTWTQVKCKASAQLTWTQVKYTMKINRILLTWISWCHILTLAHTRQRDYP